MATVGDTHDRLALYAARTSDRQAIRLVRILDLLRQGLDDPDYRTAANALIRDQLAGDHEDPERDPELGDHT
jgi:hypothetical protein